MGHLTNSQMSLLRQLKQGRMPEREVRYASTSWWFGSVSVTREMNVLKKRGLVYTWRDAARGEHVEITPSGYEMLAAKR